jgi:aminopeptidase N
MKPPEHAPPQPKYRRDYAPPPYWVDRVDLRFELGEAGTLVHGELRVRRAEGADESAPLVLDGEELELLRLAVDGEELPPERYTYAGDTLTVRGVPDAFTLASTVRIHPETNSELSGLYKSSGNFCTQCEAEGFRRITFHLDRPDVMSLYTTTIVADPDRYPVMLSNGNRVEEGRLEDGRSWVRWEDPFKKPSYLFALVAGKLACHPGTFTTRSGREVKLEIWVEPQNIDKCEHALRSLQRAMKWDEEVFGLEYDLDVYMIVAVSDFNMGAMENKGLNIFNAKYVLAKPETATDDDYEHIEGVIGHEYFHNWTGNRVTCRDWFQLTLKEGLTVFRDQLFTADMTSAAVKRISDVRLLRTAQFEEDAGPMAHPIRPESYIAMDNFYTATVYIKGAEVIRMYHTLLGAEGFRKGMDLYFARHDGEAVTCDDFRAAMADANGRDLAQFERWYAQAGTPTLHVEGVYDEDAQTYTLTFRQERADMEGHPPFEPCHLPVRLGLIGPDGQDVPLRMGGDPEGPTERVLELTKREQSFVFEGVAGRPVPSVLRGFSAPVRLEMERSREDLAFALAHDSDPFNRWDAGQTLGEMVILDLVRGAADEVDPGFVAAYGHMLEDGALDGSLRALAMALPPERVIAQRVDVIDPEAIHTAREKVLRALAEAHREKLVALYDRHAQPGPYRIEKADIDGRREKNAALAVLGRLGSGEADRAERQLETATNMTDAQAALSVLVDIGGAPGDRAVQAFYDQWKSEPLVLDKWFAVQASSRHGRTLERVIELSEHPDFTLDNPNRARSLIGAFAMNMARFHDPSARGYAFLAEQVAKLHGKNPQIAARLVSGLNAWKRFEPGRRAKMKAELERIARIEGLSKDVYEIVQRALA